jgi:hypothetical protein
MVPTTKTLKWSILTSFTFILKISVLVVGDDYIIYMIMIIIIIIIIIMFGSLPSGTVASHSFHYCITVSCCVSGNLL